VNDELDEAVEAADFVGPVKKVVRASFYFLFVLARVDGDRIRRAYRVLPVLDFYE